MLKRLLLIGLVLVLMAASASAATTLMWNEVCDETYGATVGAYAFVEKLKELSGGTMSIDLYINGMLGGEDLSMKSLQDGTLDIFRGNASSLVNYGAEEIAATGLPYLFKNMEDFEQMAVSPLGQELLNSVDPEKCHFVAIAWLVEGPRYFFMTNKAYESLGKPDSFTLDMCKNLTFRVPGLGILGDMTKALGGHPIEIPYNELKSSLQSENIDAAENGIIPYISMGFSEVAPYLIQDAHTFGCGVLLVSASTWETLTDEQKGWMLEAGKVASDACYEYNVRQEKVFFEELESKGVKLLPVSDIEKWQEACQPIYDRQTENIRKLVERFRSNDY